MGRDVDILYSDDQFAYSGRVGGFVPHSMWVNIPSANEAYKEEVAFIQNFGTHPLPKTPTVHSPMEITMGDVAAVVGGYGQWYGVALKEDDDPIKFLLSKGFVLHNDDPAGNQAESYYVPVWPPKFGVEYPVRKREAHTRHVPWKSWAQSELRERFLCAGIRKRCEECMKKRSRYILTWDYREGEYFHSFFSPVSRGAEEVFISSGSCPASHLHLVRKTHAPSQIMKREEEMNPILSLLRSAQ
jgi:hypothetical protein